MRRIARALAPLVLATFLGLATADEAERAPADARLVDADTTLADRASAGSVLIRQLPDSLSGEPVSSYGAIVIPSRGWLHGRSFFWRVPSDARGSYTFLFAAREGPAVDTLRLDVTVTAPE